MLVLSRGPEEGIMIGEDVEVRVLEVRGDRVRLGIVAPSEVPVHRKEVFLIIQKENLAAAKPEAAGLDRAMEILRGGEKTGTGTDTGMEKEGTPERAERSHRARRSS